MKQPESTCWTVIEAAAAGGSQERDYFARRYGPVIRSYLAARWQGSPNQAELDDAVQEVFVECFKEGGLLQKAERDRGSGFRAFLFGAVRNVAARAEAKQGRRREQQPPGAMDLDETAAHEATLSAIFDKAWVKALLQEAAGRLRQQAEGIGDKALRRVELLRLRFEEGLPIRQIAALWSCDADELHHEYAKVRQEFKQALLDTVAFHQPGTPREVEDQCVQLLDVFT